MSGSRPAEASERTLRQAGLTLVELMLAAAIGLILLAVLGGVLGSGLNSKMRQDQLLPLQQSVRAAAEVIAQDLRETTGARVVFGAAAYAGLTPGTIPHSNGTLLSLIVPLRDANFALRPPANYPTGTTFTSPADQLPLTSPNLEGRTCADVFDGSPLFIVFDPASGQTTTLNADGPNPCVGGMGNPRLKHTTPPGPLTYTPTAQAIRVDAVQYYTGTDSGQPALFRQALGAAPAVVAYGITALSIEYTTAGGTDTTPDGPPAAVRFTLTGQTEGNLPSTGTPGTFTVEQHVQMRQITTCVTC